MRKTTSTVAQLALAAMLVLGLLASGCGIAKQAAQSAVGTTVAQALPTEEPEPTEVVEPTEEPEEAVGEEGEEAGEEIDNALDNLVELAPLHMVSVFEYKEGEEITNKSRFEGDLDANGNQHIFISSGEEEPVEIYIVDDTMYLKGEEDQFISLGEIEEEGGFAILAVYGGAYLLAYNDLQDARRLGSESANGFDCDKYQIQYDLASAGLSGAVAGAQGVQWEYESFAWIEKDTKALVKARVDWKGKGSGDEVMSSFHSEFDATPGTVEEITAPENVLIIGE